jgi:hypothetical protein
VAISAGLTQGRVDLRKRRSAGSEGVGAELGGGEYAITLPDGPGKPGTMAGGGVGTVVGGAAGSGTENYTLTPITC